MFIKVKVLPNSKKEDIAIRSEDSFEVKVREKPEKGLANKRATEILSSYLNISATNIRLVKGAKQRNKIFEIK
jgi:uncharacterized protein YggU (UPF0235/DUF167 family)